MKASPEESGIDSGRRVFAAFDADGVLVYQAFSPPIVDEALRLGTFGRGFNLARMTWLKPSFGWMLYRSRYATSHRQERILRIRVSHQGFQEILSRGVPTSFDAALFESEFAWRQALRKTEVRYQWDPDRDLYHRKLHRRAIQLGIRGGVVRHYVGGWILRIEDVTSLAHAIKVAIERKDRDLPPVPPERAYPVPPRIATSLGLDPDPAKAQSGAREAPGNPFGEGTERPARSALDTQTVKRTRSN